MRKKIFCFLLSYIYSLFIIIGNSFINSDSFKYIQNHLFLNIFMFIVIYFIIYMIILFLFNKLDNYKLKIDKSKFENTKIYQMFSKHPFLFSLIFIIICWLPYIISFYPIILSPDPSFQIRQFFKIPNKYSYYSILIDENVLITNHHPVIHTLLLGSCVKIGAIINNVNLGLFLYSIIQIMVLAATLAYTIKFLKDLKINKKYLFLVLLIYSLVPVFPFYSMSAVKDVIFTSLIILYIMKIYRLIKVDNINIIDIIKTIILMILVILFRNNGIHVIILSFPFLLLSNKRIFKKLLFIFIVVILFNFSYGKVILPYFKITNTSIREMLSIPFQQTARYVKEHEGEVTEDEKVAIDKLLEYDTLSSRYDPEISDPVKNKFNRFYTNDDLKKYFKVWFNQLKKHPMTYIEATINNTYGYYYPLKTDWVIYYKFDKRIVDNGFDYHYNELNNCRKILSTFGRGFIFIPILGLLINIGFNVWIIIFMFMYLLYRKKYKILTYLLPSIVLFLVCIASPVNTYFRYALPYVFALMLNLGIFMKEGVLDER